MEVHLSEEFLSQMDPVVAANLRFLAWRQATMSSNPNGSKIRPARYKPVVKSGMTEDEHDQAVRDQTDRNGSCLVNWKSPLKRNNQRGSA